MRISENIKKLQEFNRDYAEKNGVSKGEVRDFGLELMQYESEIRRIEEAKKIKPAVGVFGQSQCGKSYLISELTGGSNAHLMIDGLEKKKIMDYNQINTQTESTALVTRITSDIYPENSPEKHALIKYMNPYDVMWSFVVGFYSTMKWGKFALSKEKINKINKQIENKDDGSEPIPDSILFPSEFSDCISWIEQRLSSNDLANASLGYLNRNNSPTFTIGIEKFILLASTLWYCDKNITSAFRARLETLKYLNYRTEGYLPEVFLKDALKASTLKTLTLKFNNSEVLANNHGVLLASGDNEDDSTRLANIQTVIKEVVLPVTETKNEPILENMDILDFPGARALQGMEGYDTAAIESEISDNSSSILKDVYKRGKLLYLFDVYKKRYDITLLVFCSENEPQEAPVLGTKINEWIEMDSSQKPKDSTLFVAFTKSDLMLEANDVDEDAHTRVTSRFKDNFADYYKGNWVDNYNDTELPFQNFYFVRNPQVTNKAFDMSKGEEVWRTGFEKSRDILINAFNNNKSAHKYLGSEMDNLLEQVFTPGNNGINHLKSKIINRFLSDPNKKMNFLDGKQNDILDYCISYKKRFADEDQAQYEKRQKKEALNFVSKLKVSQKALPAILNTISNTCPNSAYLYHTIRKIIDGYTDQSKVIISTPKPLKDGIPVFLEDWLKKCKKERLHEDNSLKGTKLKGSELDKFFDVLQKYLTDKETFLNELVDDFSAIFDVQNKMQDSIAVRNYLLWIVGEKVYYLNHKDTNSTPTDPVKIPEELTFNDFVLNIWEEQLPKIYSDDFQMKKTEEGKDLLDQVVFD